MNKKIDADLTTLIIFNNLYSIEYVFIFEVRREYNYIFL